jgi:hypothetical protein
MFQVGLSGQTRFQWFMFWVGFIGWIRFQLFMFQVGFSGWTMLQRFMFHVSFSGLCFNGLYHAFQAETCVGLRWHAHNDLCKLNAIYYEKIGYISKIVVLWHATSS